MWLSDAQDERLSKKLGQTLVFCNKYLTLPLKKKKKKCESLVEIKIFNI